MEEWINITEYNWAYWIAGLFALLNFTRYLIGIGSKFHEWLFKKLGITTKKMREKQEWENRLIKAENDIVEIKETAKENVQMFLDHEQKVIDSFLEIKSEVVTQLNELNDKFDEQKSQLESKLETIDADGKRRDIAVMKDRLLQGLRYFSQNKDENDIVRISITDYDNLDTMFTEYFKAGGNGTIKHVYDTEFQNFKIDSNSLDKYKK